MTESEADGAARVNRNSAAIEDLVEANQASNATMLALVDHVRKETEARDRKIEVLEKNHKQTRVLVLLMGFTAIVLLGLAVVNAVNISAAREQQDQVKDLNGIMLDCVNSTGACGQANAVQQARILDSVKQYELTGFYCARTNPANVDPKGEDFLACMARLYPGGPTLSNR